MTECEVYYLPPLESKYRTREAKRKRRSKADQERYFDDFPDENLSIKNFNYVRKPLGKNQFVLIFYNFTILLQIEIARLF